MGLAGASGAQLKAQLKAELKDEGVVEKKRAEAGYQRGRTGQGNGMGFSWHQRQQIWMARGLA
jgi:hypothetical protein